MVFNLDVGEKVKRYLSAEKFAYNIFTSIKVVTSDLQDMFKIYDIK